MTVQTFVQVKVREDREGRRQRAVESLGLGEHRRNERFDRITNVARTLLGTEMSTLTVFDGDVACFPGASGYDGAPLARDQTFCTRTSADDVVTIVEDARSDPRFDHLDAVLDGTVRFYAGVPLHDPSGNVLGVLCAFDPEPMTLTAPQLEAFLDLATWAEREMVSLSERTTAARAQASLLPAEPWSNGEWTAAGICVPALAVGGDFFDYGATGDVLHVGLVDVMGKGTGAALVGAGVRAALRAAHLDIVGGADLGKVTTQVARSLELDLERSESFVTAFQAAIDLSAGTVRFVDAGLGLALVVRRDGSVKRLTSDDRPFGILPDDHWTEQHTVLDPGDRLLVFSDGLLDFVDDKVRWSVSMGGLVAAHHGVDRVLTIVADLARSRGALDDVTALVVQRWDHDQWGERP